MFLIYKSASIPCAAAMMELWNDMAQEAGFNGMHFVETLRDGSCDNRPLPFKAKMEFEPIRTNMQQGAINLNYKRLRRRLIKGWNHIFQCAIPLNKPFRFADVARRSIELLSPEGTYGGIFVGWDNTPRRGLASTIVLPPTKTEFKDYLYAKLTQTRQIYHTNYLFINAWNEWAEGTVLEPDESHRYVYLEAIKEVTT